MGLSMALTSIVVTMSYSANKSLQRGSTNNIASCFCDRYRMLSRLLLSAMEAFSS